MATDKPKLSVLKFKEKELTAIDDCIKHIVDAGCDDVLIIGTIGDKVTHTAFSFTSKAQVLYVLEWFKRQMMDPRFMPDLSELGIEYEEDEGNG